MASFTHHDRFSKKAGIVLKEILDRFRVKRSDIRVLDLPAGAGWLSLKLREEGFRVISADINGAKDDYVFADMNEKLPFADEQFDAVVSMEGIEHIMNYEGFIGEISRITRKGGTVVLSTPNISCFYSRLMFACTGNFFQFWPTSAHLNLKNEKVFDYGHITPLTWQKIYFHFAHHRMTLMAIRGNKVKRKILLPLYIPFMIVGFPWTSYRLGKVRSRVASDVLERTDFYENIRKFSFSLPTMFSRNIVMVLEKK